MQSPEILRPYAASAERFRRLSGRSGSQAEQELWRQGDALAHGLAQELVDAGLASPAFAADAAAQATGTCLLQRRLLAASGALDQWAHFSERLYESHTSATPEEVQDTASVLVEALVNTPGVAHVQVFSERQSAAVVPELEWQPLAGAKAVLSRGIWTMGAVRVHLRNEGASNALTLALALGGQLHPIPPFVAERLGHQAASAPEFWAEIGRRVPKG